MRAKLDEILPKLKTTAEANYFTEIQDELLTNKRFAEDNSNELTMLNTRMLSTDKSVPMKIGLIYMGRQAPGGNNIVDGLLRF